MDRSAPARPARAVAPTSTANPLAWVQAHHAALLGLALLVGAFALYERTMARTVRWGDPGEFQLAAAVLGIPHPPGYPLWVIIAHLFYRFIPFGDPLWRIGLPNVLFASATVGLLYLVAQQLGVRAWVAAAAAGLFASAPLFWGEATEPRSYALNLVQIALTLWLLLKWRAAPADKRRGWLLALALSIGSAFANHGTTVTLLPGYALFMLGVEVQAARAAGLRPLATIRRRVPDYMLAAGAALLGLTPYLLPLARFLQGGGPYYWGEPQTWGQFASLLSGQVFRWMIFGRPWAMFWPQVGWGLDRLVAQFGGWAVLVGLVGWAGLARRHTLFSAMLALGWLLSFVFAIQYDAATNLYYLIPGHLFWALALAWAGEMALAALARRLGQRRMALPIRQGAQVGLALLLLAVLVGGVTARYTTAGWQRDVAGRDGAEVVLRELQPNASMYVGWEASSVMKYYQIAEGRRPDIHLKAGNPADWAEEMRAELAAGRPVYCTEPPTALRSEFQLTPVGFAYRVEARK